MKVENNFRIIKAPLNSVLRDKSILPELLKYIENTNTIMILGYSLIRLYILDRFENNLALPDLSKEFCGNVLSVINFPDKKRIHPTILSLKNFYHTHFKTLIPVDLQFNPKKLAAVCQSLSEQMATSLHNNITVHFIKRLKFMIRHSVISSSIYKDPKKQEITKAVNSILDALWEQNITDLSAELLPIYYSILNTYLPARSFEKSLGYDLEANYLDYLRPTLQMNKDLEKAEQKLFQPLSLRKTAVPKHIPLDTNNLLTLFNFTGLTKYTTSELRRVYKNVEGLEDVIWGKYFNLNNKIFKRRNNFVFAHSIETDGVSVSIRFIKKSHLQKFQSRYKKGQKTVKKKEQSKKQVKFKSVNKNSPDRLITDYTTEERELLQDRPLIGVDPGMFNLVQLTSNDKKSLKYTSRQRSKESYSTQNRKIRQRMKKNAGIQAIERVLNDHKSKTMNPLKFKEYLKCKFQTLVQVQDHYREVVYRRLNLRHFIHLKKSEAKFLKKIKTTFGSDCVLGYGNWSRSTAMKYNPPVPGKGLKRLIASKFKVITVDEFKTSSYCHCCEKKTTNQKINNKKVHRYLVCMECCSLKNGNKVRFINRDILGSRNIGKILESEIHNKGRPLTFKRDPADKETTKTSTDAELPVRVPKKTTIIKKKVVFGG